MTELTAAEQAIVRRTNYRIKRYLSFAPRDIVFQCKSTAGFDTDSETGGWIAIDYDTVSIGNYGDVQPGMTLDVGAVGSVRIRKAASSSKLYIAETGGGDLSGQGFVDDVTLTVYNERRIWPKFPYMNKIASGDYYDTFDYKVDYDVDYTDETYNYPPIVNITGDIAGFVDAARDTIMWSNPGAVSGWFSLNRGAAFTVTDYTGAVFTASSEDGTNTADRAFDNNLSTSWENDGNYPQWLQAQLSSARTINAYTIVPSAAHNDYPIEWELQGSNDGSSWSTLDYRTGQQIIYGYAQTYEVATPGSYTYYRLYIINGTTNVGVDTVVIRELALHDDAPAQSELSQRLGTTETVSANSIDLYLRRIGTPSDTVTVRIETDSAGRPSGTLISPAATGTINASSVTTGGGWVKFDMGGDINIDGSTTYHIVLSTSGSPSTTDYIEWGYSGDAIYFQPMRQITASSDAWSTELWSRESGGDFLLRFSYSSSNDYREITLSASTSEAVADGATIASYLWDINDGSFASGYSNSDATIVATFPESNLFRYISCTVTDSNGTSSTRYFPIFVHSDLNPPLPADVGFEIERDETSMVGREMDVIVYGPVDAATKDVIPEGTLAVYWEDITFDGDDPPDAYRNQFMGWTSKDSTRMSLNRDQYLVTISGPGYWLQKMRGFPMSFLDRDNPTEWYHMADPTDDRAIATILRYFTTFLDLCGLHLSDRSDEWHQPAGSDYAAIKVEKASVWDQITMLTAEYSGVQGCDSLGDMWLTRHPCLRPSTAPPTREAVDNLITLTAADRDDSQPLEIPKQHYKPYGLVQLDGFWWDSSAGINRPGRAKAPGRTPGFGVQEDIKAAQVMTGASKGAANLNLARTAGHWYAWLNSPVKEVAYKLVGNLDVADPAHMEWITISDNATLRGNQLSSERFLVDRVTVSHSFAPGRPPKTVTWYISQETEGQRGAVVYLPTSTYITDDWYDVGDWYPDTTIPESSGEGQWLLSTDDQMATIDTEGYLYITNNFSDSEPEWVRADLGMNGTPITLCPNAFSTGYLGTGTSVDCWVVTNESIYYVSDLFGSPSATEQFSFTNDGVNGTETTRNIDASFSEEGFAVVITHYQGSGTYACITTDGTNWTESAITTHTETSSAYDHMPGVYVSSKSSGTIYTAAFTATGATTSAAPSVYKSTNYGASWSTVSGYQLYAGLGSTFVAPWDDNDSDNVIYYNRKFTFDSYKQSYDLYKNVGGTHTDISPASDVGTRIGRYSIASCPINRQNIAVIGMKDNPPSQDYGLYVSTDEGSSWTTIQAANGSYKGRHVAIAGNNEDILYVWGVDGYFQYSADFGSNLSDKSGDLGDFSDPAVGDLIGILGGVT